MRNTVGTRRCVRASSGTQTKRSTVSASSRAGTSHQAARETKSTVSTTPIPACATA